MTEWTCDDARMDLRVGIVSGARNAAENLGKLCDDLALAVGCEVSPRVFATQAELRDAVDKRELEVAWASPIAAVRLELSGVASIALGIHREGGSSYSSAIFTTASSPIRELEQLRGKRIAWVDSDSAAGYVIPLQKLRAAGVTSFAAQLFEGSHHAVVRAVLGGRADAGATNLAIDPQTGAHESAGWTNVAPSAAIRILATAGPIPPDVIVIARAVPEAMQDKVTESLLAMAMREHVLALFGGRGFVLVGRYQYEALRKLLV